MNTMGCGICGDRFCDFTKHRGAKQWIDSDQIPPYDPKTENERCVVVVYTEGNGGIVYANLPNYKVIP